MRKSLAFSVATLMVGASLLMCSTAASPDRFWATFSPTYANFQRYYDDNRASLDPIEGIWVAGRAQVAIIRDSLFEDYEYVGVVLRAGPGYTAWPYSQGEIFIAFGHASAPDAYYFTCASVLRRDPCGGVPCNGTIFLADGLIRAESQLMLRGECTPDAWLKRHPRD